MAAIRSAGSAALPHGARGACGLRSPGYCGRHVRFPPEQLLRRQQRALGAVPKALWALLAASLAVQVAWQARQLSHAPGAGELPPPPSVHALRLASFAEPEAAARLLALYVQSFDLGAASSLMAWLRSILELDPRGQYPLFLA